MALHINLFHEIHREAHQRARDPKKFVGLGIAVLVLLMVGYYFYRVSAVQEVERKLANIRVDWKKFGPQEAKAKAEEEGLIARKRNNEVLVQSIQGRFYWAPFFERFSAAVPASVQILSLSGDFAPQSDRTKPPLNVLVAGLAIGSDPRSVAEEFRTTLLKELSPYYDQLTSNFDANSLEVTADTVEHGGKVLHVAKFRIRLGFFPNPPAAEKTPTANEAP